MQPVIGHWAAGEVEESLGVPIAVKPIAPGSPPELTEPPAETAGPGWTGAALIRPDGVIAWKPRVPAAEAAGRQFRFWEMHDLLFLHQRDWGDVPDPQTFFLKYAEELHLDLERFKQDLWNGEIRDKIYRDVLEGQFASVRSVPTFYLNGSLMPRTQSETQFEEVIADAIKKAK